MLKSLQNKVDKRLRELDQSSQSTGKDSVKNKSQRGGSIDVQVKHKVNWPHEAILGGATRQHMNYDQLSLTHWVQGFCRNVLEESNRGRRDIMISYLSFNGRRHRFFLAGGVGDTCRIIMRDGVGLVAMGGW